NPSELNLMPGTLIEAVFADAVSKGLLSDKNKRRALDAMLKNADLISEGDKIARKCPVEYEKLGYVPCDLCAESVNETLDSAYGDYCIAVVAKACGEDEIADKFMKRSKNYGSLFDKKTGFMRSKNSLGQFKEPFDSFDWGTDYTEGGAYQNSFAVPHDFEGLADLYGGKDAFLRKIDEVFSTSPEYTVNGYPLEIHEMTEMASVDFGQCAISNQPSFSIPFIYAEMGENKKSHDVVKRITDELFSYKDDGYPGDEDNGTMASWYIFAVLGFYPVCPGSAEFVVSGTLVDGAVVNINGKTVDLTDKIKNKSKISYFDLIK
ncbi:MAG: glycoside hydrolase family 92 protein, partial [Clostridia bacterium]|nr:glycoside hydrolase family 92 protein [Clostridia bacterium]